MTEARSDRVGGTSRNSSLAPRLSLPGPAPARSRRPVRAALRSPPARPRRRRAARTPARVRGARCAGPSGRRGDAFRSSATRPSPDRCCPRAPPGAGYAASATATMSSGDSSGRVKARKNSRSMTVRSSRRRSPAALADSSASSRNALGPREVTRAHERSTEDRKDFPSLLVRIGQERCRPGEKRDSGREVAAPDGPATGPCKSLAGLDR